ncbi:MAG: protein kinase [Lentisphaerales bacterium]|nr:protein kinase [Lentisphaerales bacterium]
MIKMGSFDTDYHIDLQLLKVYCHHCKAVISAQPEDGGKPVQCHSCGEYHIVPKSRFAPSVVIADFVLQNEIGSGGCGTVFLAYHMSLDRYCAVKILHDRILSEETYLHELMQEGRLAGKLNHPNITQCYAIGEEDHIYYYAMEYVDGKSLKEILHEKWRMSPRKSVDIILQVVAALNYAWNKERLVHRDIKPDNIMITHEGEVKLTDLGLALPEYAIQPEDSDTIKGSPHYISPEQLLDTKQDFRSDIYSLGAVFYHMVTGHYVYKARTAQEICQMHVDEPAADPAKLAPELPREISSIILKMLQKSPEDRYADYDSLKTDLQKVKTVVDTNTASQDLFTPAPSQMEAKLPVRNSNEISEKGEASLLHWLLSISFLTAFALVSYFYSLPMLKDSKKKVQSESTPVIHDITEKIILENDLEILQPLQEPKAEIFIKSMMIDPQGYDNGREWIELHNIGDAEVQLINWTLSDQENYELKLNHTLKPGETIRLELAESSINLNNGGDKLSLKNNEGKLIHEVSYKKDDVVEGTPLVHNAEDNL